MFRDATAADAERISEFVIGVSESYISETLTEAGFTRLAESMSPESTRERIDNKWTHILELEDGKILGVVVVKPECHLYHLFVDAGLHGAGHGRRLFELADERTLKNSNSRITTVNSSLNAVGFYMRLGFEPNGQEMNDNGVRFQPMTRSNSSG